MEARKEKPMIQANMDKSVMIRESDRYAYHMRVTIKRQPDPIKDPFLVEIKEEIRPIRVCDYEKYFDPKRVKTENIIQATKAIGWASAEVVHDPTLEKVEFKKIDKPEDARDSEQAFREGKRKATVKDIERIVKEQQ